MTTHDELRQRNRKRRGDLSASQLQQAAAALADRIIELPEYQQAQKLAAYYAVNGEIGLNPVIDHALALTKQVYLPNLEQQTLRFSPFFHAQKMRINRYRLPEPDLDESEMLAPAAMDLVLVPLVVFDRDGNRIGMGGGYYDRSFAFRKNDNISKPVLVGVAHELQRVDGIVPEDWDVKLDLVVSDQAMYRHS